MQFAFADRKGRLVVLRTEPLETWRLQRDGSWEGPRPAGDPRTAGLFVRDAAMDAFGERFLLLSDEDLWLVEGNRSRELPPSRWMPTAVALLGDEPVVAVLPMAAGTPFPPRAGGNAAPPFLLRLQHDRWRDLVPRPATAPSGGVRELLAESAVRLLSPDRRTLWVAGEYEGGLRRYSAAGRLHERWELPAASGDRDASERARGSERLRAELEESGVVLEGAGVGAMPRRVRVRGLGAARDGTIYLLVSGDEGGSLLYRHDPASGRTMRCAVALGGGGRTTLAWSGERLIIAPQPAREAVVAVSGEDLERAPWEEVTPVGGAR